MSDQDNRLQLVRTEKRALPEEAPSSNDTAGPSGRRPLVWSNVWPAVSVIVAIAGVATAMVFGTAALLSSHITDVSDSINAGMDRMQDSLQDDIRNVREEVREVDAKVDSVRADVSYIKGRMDQQRADEGPD